jgi:hypothetical protein
MPAADSPRLTSRPVMKTIAPSLAISLAHARPMPAVPPVISAVCPVNSIARPRYAIDRGAELTLYRRGAR